MNLEALPVYAAPDAYIMCLNLFNQIQHNSIVQYGCTFKDNILIIGCLKHTKIENANPEYFNDYILQLVHALKYLVEEEINPIYASIRFVGRKLLLENWFYSLIQNSVDSLPNVSSEHTIQRLVKEVVNACGLRESDIPQDSNIYYAVQGMLKNDNIIDSIKQAYVILENNHLLPFSPEDLFYAPLSGYHFLSWAMQFVNIKKNKQPILFSMEPTFVPARSEFSPPTVSGPLSVINFDIINTFNQHKNSEIFQNGCTILNKLPTNDLTFDIHNIPPWIRSDVYRTVFRVHSNVQSDYLKYLKIIDPETTSQIALDVPRCHSYHSVLSCPTGRHMLRRILEVWCNENKDLEYWQGIDSIAATFLNIFLFDESIAYHCFSTFIRTRLAGLFKKGASEFPMLLKSCQDQVTKEIPRLQELDIQPDLVTVPWFLTAFSRITYLFRRFTI
eukprot:NODE_2_length_91304_cov_0.692462.p15 type:complete len:445 gc:universal NODE_2_length_91304_cov_0.692462:66253-67587(+)